MSDTVNCLVVVAHPDDETIWIGGTILRHGEWRWTVHALCRRDDPDRGPRFARAMQELGASGMISDLDDSPVLAPLSPDLQEIKSRIAELTPAAYDLIITHGPHGEYTRHVRHEQVYRAVLEMADAGELTGVLACFAYEDCGGACAPHAAESAQIRICLSEDEYERKQSIIRNVYGFVPGSFEQRAAGSVEGLNACRDADERMLNTLRL